MATAKQRSNRIPFLTSGLLLVALLLAITSNLRTPSAQAAIPATLNFQARLLQANGAIVADGTYNVEFKLYDTAAAGASAQGVCVGGATDDCVWLETRTGGNMVTVKSGYLSVYLGDITAFGAIDWTQQYYLTLNIGGTGAPTWDGEMSPRLRLTSVPYAQAASQAETLQETQGANTGTLSFDTLTGNQAILLPDETGTVCLQTSGDCGFATGSGQAFLQGGNSFSGTAILGSNDAFNLEFETAGTTRLTLDQNGDATLTGDLVVQGTATSSFAGSLDVDGRSFFGNSPDAGNFYNLNAGVIFGTGGISTDCSFTCQGIRSTITLNNPSGAIARNGAALFAGTATGATVFTANNLFGLYIQDGSAGAGSTITNNYGIYLEGATKGTNDYGIYIGGADTYSLQVAAGISRFDGLIEPRSLGAADSATYLCRNSSNQLATCSGTLTGSAFVQGGNSFGTTATLGTNDSTGLQLETFGTTRLTISSGGDATFSADLTVQGGDIVSSGLLRLTSASTNPITLDSGSTGGVNVGTGSNSKTVTVGNTTTTTALVLQSGTGDVAIQSQDDINIGTNAIAQDIVIGNSTGATSVSVNCGTGVCNFGTNAIAHTTTIGSVTGVASTSIQAGTGDLNIGTTAQARNINIGTAAAQQIVNIGSTSGTGQTNINSNNINIGANFTTNQIYVGNSNIATSTVTLGSDYLTSSTLLRAGTGDLTLTSQDDINIGTNAVAQNITIGNLTGATSVAINTGSGNFAINTDDLFVQTSNGAIGIGTISPQSTLHVVGNGDVLRLQGTDHAYIEFYPDGAGGREAYLGFGSNGTDNFQLINESATGVLELGTNAGADFTIDSSGNITATGTVAVQGASVTVGASALQGSLVLHDGDGETVTITIDDITASSTIKIPNTAGVADTLCLLSLNNCAGSAFALQQSYDADVDGSDAVIALTSTDGGVIIRDNVTPLGSTLFAVQNSAGSANYLNIAASGITTDLSVTLAANQTLRLTGGTTANRPGSPTEGMLYFDTDTDTLLTYANGKWQATTGEYIIVAASDSSQAEKDAAHYVADGDGGGAGDGDQVQINSALTAASGGKVYLAAGTYVADGTILIPNNTTLAGAGRGTLIELGNLDATENLIENSDTTTGTGVVIQDLRLDGRDDLNTAGTQKGIYLNSMGSDSRPGAKLTALLVEDFRNEGFYLENSQNNTLTNSEAKANSNGIYIYNNSNSNIITGNVADSNSISGFQINSSDFNTLTGNVARDHTNNGFSVGLGDNNILVGNTAESNGIGINISVSNNNTVASNNIHDSGGATANNGIYVDNFADNNNITGNTITDTSCTTTCYAINIFSSSADTNYLASNTLGSGTINDAGTGTIYGGQVDSSGNYDIQPAGSISLLKNTDITGNLDVSGTLTVGSTNQLTVDASGNLATSGNITAFSADLQGILLGTSSSIDGSIIFRNSSNSFLTTLINSTTSADRSISLPDEDGTICLQSSVSCGFASSASAFVQDGNTFAVAAVLGTNDSQDLAFETNNTTRITVNATTGNVNFTGSLVVAATQTLTVTGSTTANRPASPTEGMIYFDTDTDTLLTYANGKWQATTGEYVIVAASNSSQAIKDAAHYVADGDGGGAGDGDQVQINAALTAASGGKVYLAAGTYVADATILIPNNTTLAGAGRGTLIELGNLDATENLIENSDTTTGTGVTIQDLRLDGRDDLNTAGTQHGIYLDAVGDGTGASARQGAKVVNLWVNRFRDTGLQSQDSSNSVFINNTFQDNSYGVVLHFNSDNNTLTGNTFQGNGTGVRVDGSDNNTLTGNTAQGNSAEGIEIDSASLNNTLTGNTAQGNSYGFAINGGSNNNTLTGNTAQGNSVNGIDIDSSSGNTITGNTTQGGQVGISLNNTSQNNTINGNSMRGNSLRGIHLFSSSNNNIVTANKIHDNGGATTNDGVYLNASDSNTITGNSITDTSCTTNCYAINVFNSTSDTNYLADNTLGGGTINDAGTGTIYGGQLNSAGDFNIQPAGNVTIGTLTSDAKLEVLASSTSTTAGTLKGGELTVTDTGIVTTGTDITYGQRLVVTRTGATGGTINAYGLDIQATADNAGAGTSTLTGLNVNVSGADTNYAALFQGGNVGIGTATPDERLQITGGNILLDNNRNIQFKDSVGTKRNVLTVDTADDVVIGNTSLDDIRLQVTTVGTALLVQKATGFVGIGDTSPQATLHVDGTVRFEDFLSCTAIETDVDGDIVCGADDVGTTPTIQTTYDADADGSDATISLTTADDSLVISNPSSSGTDSAFVLKVEQLNTGTVQNALVVTHAGGASTYALRINDDGTDTDSTPLIVDNAGYLALGTTTATQNSTTAALTILPQGGDAINGITIKAPNSTWGDGQAYGHGQVFQYLNHTCNGGISPNDCVLFRIDNTGGVGLAGGIHVATGLRQDAGYSATQAVWINPSIDAIGVISSQIAGAAANHYLFQKNGTSIASISSDGYFRAGTGTVSTPGVSFHGDQNTGLYSGGADRIDLATGGINTASFSGGNLQLQNVTSDATIKGGVIAVGHYTNAQPAFSPLYSASTSTANNVAIGGGHGSFNAATGLFFYTAANNTTLTGTVRATIDSTGNFGIGDITPDGRLDVELASTNTTGATDRGYELRVTDTGVVTTGTDTTYGQQLTVTRTGATGGTINTYGLDIQATGDTGGTSTLTGLNVNVSGADANYAAIFQGGNVGIGTATPLYELDVVGEIRAQSSGTTSDPSFNINGQGGLYSPASGQIALVRGGSEVFSSTNSNGGTNTISGAILITNASMDGSSTSFTIQNAFTAGGSLDETAELRYNFGTQLGAGIISGKEGSFTSAAGRSAYLAFTTNYQDTVSEKLRITADGNVGINDTTPDFKFEVQGTAGSGYLGITNSTDGDILSVTSTGVLKVATTAAETLTNAKLLVTSAEVTTALRIGTATDGVSFNDGVASKLRLRGTARNDVTVALRPEFEGATFRGDGSNNTGVLNGGFCSNEGSLSINTGVCAASTDHSYYEWSHSEASAQDYDIIVRYKMPSDFDSGTLDDAGSITVYGWHTDDTTNKVEVSLYNDAGALCGTANQDAAGTAVGAWNALSFAGLSGDTDCGNVDAGEYITFVVHMIADQNDTVRLGEIEITYKGVY